MTNEQRVDDAVAAIFCGKRRKTGQFNAKSFAAAPRQC
jgi:hypothetical protein